jgi:hypothetical protein
MRIPADGIIAEDKLTHYLLVQRLWDDKSGFLCQAGFVLEKWTELRDAIRVLSNAVDAVDDGTNEYGTFYRADGDLTGPIGSLSVTLIWMRRNVDTRFYFVTLKPRKE